MDAIISPAKRSVSMAGIIWRRRARLRDCPSFRKKTGSVRGRPFKLPRARKKKDGLPEAMLAPRNRMNQKVMAGRARFQQDRRAWEKRNGPGNCYNELRMRDRRRDAKKRDMRRPNCPREKIDAVS